MKVGVTLPQFREDPMPAIATARAAEEVGLDGVFVFDHLWAIGHPDRPALSAFPLLGALAVETRGVSLGTLVARVGLVPDAVLVHQFETLHRIVGGRLIAGLGTGDRLSAEENLAYDVEYPPADERRAAVARCAQRLRAIGITTWVGGLAEATRAIGRSHADAINLWDVEPEEVSAERASGVTWGGNVQSDAETVSALLVRLRDAGASWAVCAPKYGDAPIEDVKTIARAAEALL